MKETNNFFEKLFNILSDIEIGGFDSEQIKNIIADILQGFFDWIYDLFVKD